MSTFYLLSSVRLIIFQLARKFHPDTNADKGARDKFVEIQEAYDVSYQFDYTQFH